MRSESTKSNKNIIRFNVGGHFYEVSRSLIELHENTMLAALVSDLWFSDPDATIFIDRDGERFKYILDYLRYGKVSLPITVPREMFLMDMDYYGLNTSGDGTAVNNRPPTGIDEKDAIKEVALQCVKIFNSAHLAMQAMKDSKQELETEILCLEMATFYAKIFYCEIREHSSLTTTYSVTTADYKKSQAFWKYLASSNHDLFQRSLARFGLQLLTKRKVDGGFASADYYELIIEALET